MEITARNEFAASPAEVYAMLTDKAFQDAVCEATEALRHEVKVEGNRVTTVRALPTPPEASKFIKGDLVIQETTDWSEAAGDGSRSGTITLTSPSTSLAKMDGTARLAPGGAGTVLDYRGDFRINVPFLGKSLEKQAAPVLQEALSVQQRVGEKWLAEH